MKLRLILMILLALSLIFASQACTEDDDIDVGDLGYKWPLGLHVLGTANVVTTTEAYKQTSSKSTFKSKGTINSGNLAGQPSGKTLVVEEFQVDSDWVVVGHIQTDPFYYTNEDYQEYHVSVVESVAVRSGQVLTEELTREEAANGGEFVYTTKSVNKFDRETSATSFGLLGDKYVLQMNDLSSSWSRDLLEHPEIHLLGKIDPSIDDYYVSANGQIRYRVYDKESMDIGDEDAGSVYVIELRSSDDISQFDILNECLIEDYDEDELMRNAGQAPPNFEHDWTIPILHLDPGCENNFLHRKVGTEWWYENVLVKEESTYYTVEVTDYGYEWIEINGTTRTRRTSRVMTPDVPTTADRFIEFKVTKIESSYEATDWWEDEEEVPTEDFTSEDVEPSMPNGGPSYIGTGGGVADGDVEDGDVEDGDVEDGDVTDGDVTDGDVSNFCEGYTGSDPCCKDDNSCGLASNGSCDCDNACNWDFIDCVDYTDGDATDGN